MNKIYLLHHTHEFEDWEEVKIIGIYSTNDGAMKAINALKELSGFKDYPNNFKIETYNINETKYSNGFIPSEYEIESELEKNELTKLIERFNKEYSILIKEKKSEDHSQFILSFLNKTKDSDEIAFFLLELKHEYLRIGRNEDARALILETINNELDHPYPYIEMAEYYHYHDVNLNEALNYIKIAIVNGQKLKTFVYQALGVQARICIETENWELLTKTLIDLEKYEHRVGNSDVFPEKDFLNRIPDGKIDKKIISAYITKRNELSSQNYSTLYNVK